jgi:hypothetical protein
MTKQKTVNSERYRKTELSEEGEVFEIESFESQIIDPWSPIYKDITKPFDFHKYTCPRLPISMGQLEERIFENLPDVLRLPIKWNGSNEVRLPKELSSLDETLKIIMQYDRQINPFFTEFFTHITIDNSEVDAGRTQRYPGFHGDDLQDGDYTTKACAHSYVYVNNNPTEITMQPFFVAHLGGKGYNVFKEFDRQVKRVSTFKTIPNHLYLMDPYVVHASPKVEETTRRIFFRLTLTPSELLLPNNTINPMFAEKKYPVKNEVKEFGEDPDIDLPLEYYGFSGGEK